MNWVQDGLNQLGYSTGVDELRDVCVFFYSLDMAVKEFDDEKIVDKHYHKDEHVYWGKFSNIHMEVIFFYGVGNVLGGVGRATTGHRWV